MQDIVRLSGDVQSTGKGFIVKENGEKKIILHHSPFIRKSDIDTPGRYPTSLLRVDYPLSFDMKVSDWPANSYEARQAKQHLGHTHTVQCLPATDSRGQVIHPAEYESFLRGCTAVIWFSVHKHMTSDGDSYRARIELIRTVTLPDPRSRTMQNPKVEAPKEEVEETKPKDI